MEYNFKKIEDHWQQKWKRDNVYKISNESDRPPFYVLDMFPYPSGAGLHVGHPLGYIASDIFSRYKRLKGFNVLHPMGFDSFGLPAEQYALETGQHPADTTENNISTFKKQLGKIGFSYDWSRELRTSDPDYYRWTQWIFLKLFNSYFCNTKKKALPISELIDKYAAKGAIPADGIFIEGKHFTAEQWAGFSKKQKEEILMKRRLAFSAFGEVNWCEALGTVLANDEVVNGVSERGGHPVIKKKMRQWYLRITSYADRLLEGLDKVDFSESMKEMQRNWIGKSEGAEISFPLIQETETDSESGLTINVYTTRPDTIFGVDFLVIAPEHELVQMITTSAQRQRIDDYLTYVKSRSDRERMSEVKQITGCFTGAFAINPFNNKPIPVWIAEYVLAGYGTGAIMAVPCGDQRDFLFARHFNIPITNIIGKFFTGEEANPTKEALLSNSGFMDGLVMKDAIQVALDKIVEMDIGKRKVNYRMRDAGFSRQRYWGEPFPIVWKDGVALPLDENELPLQLPHLEKYGPGPEGEGPLANAVEWTSSPTLLHGEVEDNFDLTQEASKDDFVNLTQEASKNDFVDLTPNPSLKEKGTRTQNTNDVPRYITEWKKTIAFAKENRHLPTEAEDTMWQILRNRNVDDLKFRRQHPVAGYIPDFVCLENKLIVEIDGGYHDEQEEKIFDAAREEWLKEFGFSMIRFSNEEVKNNVEAVKKKISNAISSSPLLDRNADSGSSFSPLLGKGVGDGSSFSPLLDRDANSGSSFSPLLDRGVGGEVKQDSKAKRETSTMPGYAGSSWYFLRYMDPKNANTFCDRKISDYWGQVDVYVGGTEHAVGHLLYSRMWTKVLYDLDLIGFDEPFKKLVNQGMITGRSYFFNVEKNNEGSVITSYNKNSNSTELIRFKYGHQFVNAEGKLLKNSFEESKMELPYDIVWEKEGGEEYIMLKEESEKMSKSKFNVDNPDDIVEKYGADTFRMYEMFLGPVEQSKPWDTKGIEGVHRFLRKLWRLFYDDIKGQVWDTHEATQAELKILHRTIKKIGQDTENFSFNTAVSAFMVAVNELTDVKCHKKTILEKLLILLVPYAPHISEELWTLLGNSTSILDASFPVYDGKYLLETSKEYPVSVNGKLRTTINISLDAAQPEIDKIILENDIIKKWLEGNLPKKIIFVKGKMINVVI
ncbi:MAG: DUF559 domain-containing protein [Ferruginibacter sp.]